MSFNCIKSRPPASINLVVAQLKITNIISKQSRRHNGLIFITFIVSDIIYSWGFAQTSGGTHYLSLQQPTPSALSSHSW